MFRPLLIASTILVSMAGAADAALISFTSDGNFSNITGYTPVDRPGIFTGNYPSASITNSGNQLNMGGDNSSQLNANDFSAVGLTTNLSDQKIGQITWINRASTGTDGSFNATYTLTLTFSAPNSDVAGQTFNINIQQPTNPPGDTVSGLGIVGLPSTFNLNGVAVDDFKFVATGGSSSFSNGMWYNPEGTTSTLILTADFKSTAVPEPVSLVLLGTGLLGIGLMRRKRV